MSAYDAQRLLGRLYEIWDQITDTAEPLVDLNPDPIVADHVGRAELALKDAIHELERWIERTWPL
jgi:hypothetical protein